MEHKDNVRAYTKEENDKKCPKCGGTMDFNPGTGGLLCPYCDYQQEITTEEVSAEELDFDSVEKTGNFDWGAEKKTVICKSCGAHSVYDALQISDECPYCGSNHVMEEKSEKTLAPGGVCIFKIDKNQAGTNFKRWIGKKLFCPKIVKEKAKPKSFRGVYLPYWTFDTQTYSVYSARYGRTRHVRSKDGKIRTVTDWYNTSGRYNEFINDQLILATNQHDYRLLSRVEPFNTEDNLIYKPEYVAGFISERYSVGIKDAWKKAKEFINRHLHNEIRSKIRIENRADVVAGLRVQTNYSDIKYKYLLLPIWLSSFRYKDKVYEFMVNGQTGKVGGRAPVSALRVLAAILMGIIIITGIYLISRYFNM